MRKNEMQMSEIQDIVDKICYDLGFQEHIYVAIVNPIMLLKFDHYANAHDGKIKWIAINSRSLKLEKKYMRQILEHEIAHLVMKQGHTAKFRQFCKEHNIDWRARGVIGGLDLKKRKN